jgi:hypothetical protein
MGVMKRACFTFVWAKDNRWKHVFFLNFKNITPVNFIVSARLRMINVIVQAKDI